MIAIRHLFTFLSLSCAAFSAYPFPCFFTAAKAPCWRDYEVIITVSDAQDHSLVAQIKIPKGTLWQRAAVDCKPGQQVDYSATFSPALLVGEEHKIYQGITLHDLPQTIVPDIAAWELKICYPADFSDLTYPLQGKGSCACAFNKVPPVHLTAPTPPKTP